MPRRSHHHTIGLLVASAILAACTANVGPAAGSSDAKGAVDDPMDPWARAPSVQITPIADGLSITTPTGVMEVVVHRDSDRVAYVLDGVEVMSVPVVPAPEVLGPGLVLQFTDETLLARADAFRPLAGEVYAAAESNSVYGPMLASNADDPWVVCVTQEVIDALEPPTYSESVPFWMMHIGGLVVAGAYAALGGAFFGAEVGGPWGAVVGAVGLGVGVPIAVELGLVTLISDC